MSDIIRLLPDSVANQIAAGEVIQRPASVIKELVENSVDAGATDIKVYIKDAGRTLIQVVDNGNGMSETDARMAFERHATSKIKEATDLFSLHTMGFRGEALPSICAISQVELLTKTSHQQLGTRLRLNASRVECQESAACEIGTSITVKNLFFNVPARRKFLKSDNVELSNVMREFERLALVNNKIRMSIDTGNRILDLKPATFKQRIADIWKNALDLHLVPVDVDTSLVKISGFVSRPEYARRRNPLQFLIVNGRNMKHPYFHKAIVSCFDSLIATDTQPCYFLKFEVAADTIDVNIHPTKNEIKFEYEQDIWSILQASVKAALGKCGAVPSIDFDLDPVPVQPLPKGDIPKAPSLDISPDYNPFQNTFDRQETKYPAKPYNYEGKNLRNNNWDILYSEFLKGTHGFGDQSNIDQQPQTPTLPGIGTDIHPSTICIQFADKYILTTGQEGILIIDQRRAHIKVLYNEFYTHLDKEEQVSQSLLFPDSIEVEPSMYGSFEEIIPDLQKAGFKVDYEEENRWKITAVPAIAKDMDAVDIIKRMLDTVNIESANYGKETSGSDFFKSRLALEMARSGAVNYGRKLSEEEMEHIVSGLFSLSDPLYTPNGNKIYHVIDEKNLNSIFR